MARAIRLYNTLTRRKEKFVPLKEGKVSFYLCGPTVYNHIHIGNARTFLSFDVIRRYLEYAGYEVTFVQNITDVDDKIINRANEEGRTAVEVAAEYSEAFVEGMHALGVLDPTIRPRATEEIPAMIELISCLVEGGHAYEVEGDVYFSVRSFSPYGRLSGRDIEQMRSGARVEVDPRKRDALDFALWKKAKPGEPSWESPWSVGRPGWHSECSAMSARYLGNPFDIHAGGDDLIFPHHENEIAQAESCYHVTFANYWLHGGMLTIDHEKMAKSEGNFLLLKDVLTYVRPFALRLLMLQTHYRSPFDYSAERLQEATAAFERIESALRNLSWTIESYAVVETAPNEIGDKSVSWTADLLQRAENTRERFINSMDDDFNTAGAVAAIFELVTAGNASVKDGIFGEAHRRAVIEARDTIAGLLNVLGVTVDAEPENGLNLSEEVEDLKDTGNAGDARDANDALAAKAVVELAASLVGYLGESPVEAIEFLLAARDEARAEKDWARADAMRDGLNEVGLVIEDTASGTRIVRK
ncbi:MAG: cysteine--tRNA ligase [Coriobacteriales bacterium]|jgi:cysteinyl-tRNA synthetase|nr:cysteine--tRNA ligase [Coriobacteriales bacterium]